MKLPDEFRHPSGGEAIDRTAQDAIRLAHRALERFPNVVRQHKFIAGGAAISSALVALAGVAVTRRMRGGASAEQAVQGVTEDELSGLFKAHVPERTGSGEEGADNGAGPDGGAEPGAADDEAVAVVGVDGGSGESNGAPGSAAREARRSS